MIEPVLARPGPVPRWARVAGLAALLVCLTAGSVSFWPGRSGALAQGPSGQGEIQSLINRIDRLQRELTTLQRQVYRGGAAPAPLAGAAGGAPASSNLVAAMQVRMDEIETEMRRFTGRMEELQHAVDTVRKSLDKMASDIDFRLKRLEGGQAAPGGPQTGVPQAGVPAAGAAGLRAIVPPRPSPGAPSAAGAAPSSGYGPAPLAPQTLGTIPRGDLDRQKSLPQGAAVPGPAPRQPAGAAPQRPRNAARALVGATPQAQYKHATDLLFRSDYDGAQRAFAAFVKAHPKHSLAGNAQYWLGETHYARGAYRTAAAVFAEGYQKYPNSPKGPDNLLKLGMSLVAIDKNTSACDTFRRLLKEYPKATKSVRSSARTQRKKLRCRR